MKPQVLIRVTLKKIYKLNRCRTFSITVSAVESWNKIQKQLKNMQLKDLSPNVIKSVASNCYLKSYLIYDFNN